MDVLQKCRVGELWYTCRRGAPFLAGQIRVLFPGTSFLVLLYSLLYFTLLAFPLERGFALFAPLALCFLWGGFTPATIC